ncbi:MAG TPA: zinc-binding dehydrogenase [Mycobacterium sp.]
MADLSGCGFGAFAEFACPPAPVLRRKPGGLSWVEAAAVPQAGSLAVLALRTGGPVRPNQAVLLNGAGGGVGTFAVQTAAWQGAEVTGVDRADRLETVKAVGAQYVIDYARRDLHPAWCCLRSHRRTSRVPQSASVPAGVAGRGVCARLSVGRCGGSLRRHSWAV